MREIILADPTARQLHALKQHYAGKLRLSDVKEMFEQMKDD